MVDWNFLDTRKKITLALGGGALVVAVVVLGATVFRISNLRTVLERPRAINSTYSCSDLGSSAPLSRTRSNGGVWEENATYNAGSSVRAGCLWNNNGDVRIVGNAAIYIKDSFNYTRATSVYGEISATPYTGTGVFTVTCGCGSANSTTNFTLVAGGGGGCSTIDSSASPSTVSAGGAITFRFSSANKSYNNVQFNAGGGASSCTLTEADCDSFHPETNCRWVWNCTAAAAGSYTGTFNNDASCSKTVSYTVISGGGGGSGCAGNDNNCSPTQRCVNNSCAAVTCGTAPTCQQYTVSNHACVLSNLTNGTACSGGTCQNGTCQAANVVPNCSNLSGPPRLTVGQAGTYTARFYSQVANSKGRIDIADATKNPAPLVPPWGSSQNYVDSKETGVVDGNSGTGSISWTPTTTGTYFLYCRAWNDGIAECRGDAAYVDGPPRYTCAGPNSSMTVNVIGESVTTPTPTVVVPTPTPTPFAPPPITPPVGCPQKGYGDADCNGCVDGIDYSIWLNSQCHPGQTQSCADTRADFNLDGKVDDDDYKLWFDGRNIVPCIE